MSKTRTLMVFGAVCVLFLTGVVTEASAGLRRAQPSREKGLIGYWKFYGSTVDVTKADVAAKKTFTFTSKVGGKLDYVLMYLRERNGDTPKNICTPMDAYRGAILKK